MTATSLDRIVEYVDAIHRASQPMRVGEMSVKSVESMIIDAICLQSALSAYLMRCDLQRGEEAGGR